MGWSEVHGESDQQRDEQHGMALDLALGLKLALVELDATISHLQEMRDNLKRRLDAFEATG